MTHSIKTLCPYCGVGCGLDVSPPAAPNKPTYQGEQGVPIWKVKGDRSHPSSLGMVCVKGATVTQALHHNRLQYPMWRDSLDQEFRRISWDEAMERMVDRIQQVCATQGADALCMYGSGQMQTEDYYVAQKLLKGCLGTNNFDSNSRLCMSSAVKGYVQSLGSDGPPCCYDDLELTDCAFLIGTNTAECHPIIYNRLRKHHKANAQVKLIVVDPRQTITAQDADLHLAIRPGTDIDLLNGIAHLLLNWGLIDQEFIEDCTGGFAEFVDVVRYYSPSIAADRCGISVQDLETAARWWGQSERVLSLWAMGMNQSSEGTAKVRSLINLHLMTAQIGKPGAGPFSLTGQPNAMGGRESGGTCQTLPGYRLIKNPQHRAEVEQFWGLEPGSIAAQDGRTAWEMIQGLETGEVQFLWIVATNPAVSLPDLERAKAALQKSPFIVYQDAYYPTETAAYAHLLLPVAQWSEKTGTMTNSERCVTLCPAFRSSPGEARPDWQIFAEVGHRLGFAQQLSFADSSEIYAEFVQLTRDRLCDQTGITYNRLRQEGPIQYPCSDQGDRTTTKRLYTNSYFATPNGRARFAAYHSRGLAERPDPNYPFVLTTGRLYGHWHTQTRTGHIEKICKMHPQPFIEIHPKDARSLNIQDQDWVEVRSRRGASRFPAKITTAIASGTLFVPIHWGALWADQADANTMTHTASCPDSLQPELKACAVQLVPVRTSSSKSDVHSDIRDDHTSSVSLVQR